MRAPLLNLALWSLGIVALCTPIAAEATRSIKDETMSADITVQALAGGAPYDLHFDFFRPDKFRVETAKKLILSDGTNIFTFNKSETTYTKQPYSAKLMETTLAGKDTFAWAAFMFSKPEQLMVDVKENGKRTLRGIEVKMLSFSSTDKKVSGTIYVQPASNTAQGAQIETADGRFLIWAKTLQIGDPKLLKLSYEFKPPVGVTEAVAPPVPAAVGWTEVSKIFNNSCMPCHGQAGRANVFLGSYADAKRSSSIVAGSADGSALYRAVVTGGMPKNRPKLTPNELATIKTWIDSGAKE